VRVDLSLPWIARVDLSLPWLARVGLSLPWIARVDLSLSGIARVDLSLSGIARVGLRFGTAAAAELQHVPVEDVIVGEALPMEQVPEQLPQIAETSEEHQDESSFY
jgi:hypothetical protein